MNPTHFKTVLLQQRKEVEATIEQAAESAQPVELDQTTQGRVSRIDAIQQQEMVKAAQRRREEQLIKIDAALKRIADGDFGYCMTCDEEIPEKRLALDPTTLKCIACAS
jgi:DnaK suppressor protein